MKEKIEPGESPLEQKKSQESYAPTAAEEAVLYDLHTQAERHKQNGEKDEKRVEAIHSDIRGCECFPLLEEYAGGKTPSFESMFAPMREHIRTALETAQKEHEKYGDEHSKALLDAMKILSGREQQVLGSIQRYVQSVIRFRELQKISLGGVRDVQKQFESADHARRRAHNSLLDTLTLYSRTLEEAAKNDLIPKDSFSRWTIGEDARSMDPGKAVIFEESVMRNRDFVRDWAIVVDFVEQLKSLGDEEWLKTIGGRSE